MSKQPGNAANSLLSSLGGWLTANRDIDKQALFPLASYVKTTTSDSLSSEPITTVLDNSTFLPKLSNSPIKKDIITAIPVYFRQYNVSLITFTTLGNDYISLKTQYYHADNSPITKEVEIGRFLDLKMHSVAVFNESAMALAYSIRKPGAAVSSASYGYTILLQYITPQATRIVNIAQNTNGIFGIDIVPTIDSSTKLLVSYAGNDNVLYTQKCEITSSMMSHVVITNQPISMPQSGIITVYVNAFQAQTTLGQSNQATFNVVWSYLDQSGIYIQRYNLNDGSPVGTTTNILSEPDSLRVGSDEIDKTIIVWQSNNNPQQTNIVNLQLLSQDQAKTQSYKQLNFQSGNYSIIDASVLPATNRLAQQSPIAIDLINNNNQTKTIVLDANSNQLLNISLVSENTVADNPNSKTTTISAPTALSGIDNTNANSYPFADILGKISKININAPQCLAQTTATSQIPEVQRVFEQYQNMLKEQPELISQVQSLLSNTKLTEALGKLGIKKETLYSIMNNANSVEDVISSFQKFNPFKDLDLSQIPDTDISAQIAQARTFNQTMSSTILGDGTGTGSTASANNLLIQLLDLINNNASEEQFVEFFATTTKNELVQTIRELSSDDVSSPEAVANIVVSILKTLGIGFIAGNLLAEYLVRLALGKVDLNTINNHRHFNLLSAPAPSGKTKGSSFMVVVVTVCVIVVIFIALYPLGGTSDVPSAPPVSPPTPNPVTPFPPTPAPTPPTMKPCPTYIASNPPPLTQSSNPIVSCMSSSNLNGLKICGSNQQLFSIVEQHAVNYYNKISNIISLNRTIIEANIAYTHYICNTRTDAKWNQFYNKMITMRDAYSNLTISLFKINQCVTSPPKQDDDCIYFLQQAVNSAHVSFDYNRYYYILNHLTSNLDSNYEQIFCPYHAYTSNLTNRDQLSIQQAAQLDKLVPFGFATLFNQRPSTCINYEITLCAATFLSVQDNQGIVPTIGQVIIHELAHNAIDTEDCTLDNFCHKVVGAPSWYCPCDGAIIGYNKNKCIDYICEASMIDSTCWEAFITEFA